MVVVAKPQEEIVMSRFLAGGYFYESKHILGQWMMSEKLDGMSAFWDGGYSRGMILSNVPFANLNKVKNIDIECTGLWSRMGKVIHAPDWFLDKMPPFAVTGELYAGKGKFQTTMSIVRKNEPGEEWECISYNVFDAPNRMVFSERAIRVANGQYWVIPEMSFLAEKFCLDGGRLLPWETVYSMLNGLPVIDNIRIDSGTNLWKRRDTVIKKGGEGIVLKHSQWVWSPERSKQIFKMKGILDCHVEVTGKTEGKGRNKGKVGAWIVRDIETGVAFKVNARGDTDRESNRIGETVRVLFRELTDAGVPKDGRIV